MNRILLVLAFIGLAVFSRAQSCDKLNIQQTNEIRSECKKQVMTMTYDLHGRPYIYLANKEAGLTVYKFGTTKDPLQVGAIGIDKLDSLEVMGVSQYGDLLYLALGNFFTRDQNPGMAIVDVKNPELPELVTFWKSNKATEGSSMVKVEGSYAYLAAFSHGIMVLNVSDHQNITLESEFVPDLNFPEKNPDVTKINARGMVVDNDVIYLSYDAGGIRVINVKDKMNPRETGRYSNPILNGKPRAYNNVVLRDSILYVGVDYCGVEILNVKDTSDIKLMAWWNPWECETSPLNWFSSPGHVNEVVLDSAENKLFVSSGKSDMHVIDVSDPYNPDSCSIFGGVDNKIGTWGVNRYKNKLCLSYICTLVPFSSNFAGVKMLEYHRTSDVNDLGLKPLNIRPNPVRETLIFPEGLETNLPFQLYSLNGRLVADRRIDNSREFDMSQLLPGMYVMHVHGYLPQKLIKL